MRKDYEMRNGILGIVTAVVITGFLAGCQQQQQATGEAPKEAPNERQARLLAVQSADLQKQLAAREADLTALQQKYAQDIQQRDEELAKCKAQIEALQKDVDKGIAERVSGVTATLMEENGKLRKEIEQLKAQVDELKRQPQPQVQG